jgi:hypothetical protein
MSREAQNAIRGASPPDERRRHWEKNASAAAEVMPLW